MFQNVEKNRIVAVSLSFLFFLAFNLSAQQKRQNPPNGSGSIGLPASISFSACPPGVGDLDLQIFDGGTNEVAVPDSDEETIGAVTVANLNDTDGDKKVDNDDELIEVSTPGAGENIELDMMKLIVTAPSSIPNGKKANITLKIVSGSINIYESKNKEGGFFLSKDKNILSKKILMLKNESKTFYVEATAASTAVGDIEIKVEYGTTSSDVVKATAVWVQKTKTTNTWVTRSTQQELNPKPGEGVLNCLDEPTLITVISNRISTDGTRYGHGFNGKNKNATPEYDQHFGGRILFEYIIYPLDISKLGSNKIYFDCTRRKNIKRFLIEYGKPAIVSDVDNFPLHRDQANDDGKKDDEDNMPCSNKIYAWDSPGGTHLENQDTYAYWCLRMQFQDFVRISINNSFPDIGNGLFGSRASEKNAWHSFMYLKRENNDQLSPDNQPSSYSMPKKTSSSSSSTAGKININLIQPNTHSYEAVYNINDGGTWKLKIDGANGPNFVKTGTSPKKWEITYQNEVNIVITEESTPFYNNDKYRFAVFVSQNKVNETGLNYCPGNNGGINECDLSKF